MLASIHHAMNAIIHRQGSKDSRSHGNHGVPEREEEDHAAVVTRDEEHNQEHKVENETQDGQGDAGFGLGGIGGLLVDE